MRGSAAGGRNERVGGDVERKPEAVARRVREAPFEVARVREGDGVDEEVELAAEGLCHLGEGLLEPFVGANVALADERAPDGLGQVAHAFFDPLALVGERELRAAGRERCAIAQAIERRLATPRTRPRLPSKDPGTRGAVYSRASNEGFARWALDASCR